MNFFSLLTHVILLYLIHFFFLLLTLHHLFRTHLLNILNNRLNKVKDLNFQEIFDVRKKEFKSKLIDFLSIAKTYMYQIISFTCTAKAIAMSLFWYVTQLVTPTIHLDILTYICKSWKPKITYR